MTMETDSGLLLETDQKPEEKLETVAEEQVDTSAWDDLIEMVLDLDPGKYGKPFSDIELQKMREILTAGRGKFPKKVIPYVELMRKFLFANFQLIAMAALAHRTAEQKRDKEESLIKPASFSDLGKVEASRIRGE